MNNINIDSNQIIDEQSEKESTKACLPFIETHIKTNSVSAILIACFSGVYL